MNTAETSIPGIERLEKPALVGGLAALVLCAALGFRDPTQFFRSYLLAFVFWIGLPLGLLRHPDASSSGRGHVGIPPAPPARIGDEDLLADGGAGAADSFPVAGAV